MTAREAGWYWVRANGGVPEIAEWDAVDRCWRSTYWQAANGMGACVAVLSPRLLPPPPDASPVHPLTVRWNVPLGADTDADTSGVLHGGGTS